MVSDFTGERIIPDEVGKGPAFVDHLARYDWIKQFTTGKKVLDAGCGAGYGAALLAEGTASEVVGIDLSEEAIKYAKANYSRPNLIFEVMDCYATTFPDESFDVICSFEVIEHIDSPDGFLRGMKRLVVKGGSFIVSTPNKNFVSRGLSQPYNPFHIREYYLEEFRELLETYFNTVEIWGQTMPAYDNSLIQRVWNRFPKLKCVVPWKIQVAGTKFLNRRGSTISLDDVSITKDSVESSKAFIAICKKQDT